MGYFKVKIHKDEMGKKWKIYLPTIKKKGAKYIKGKKSTFVKLIK